MGLQSFPGKKIYDTFGPTLPGSLFYFSLVNCVRKVMGQLARDNVG